MKSKHADVSVNSSTWTELSEDFDILSWGVYSDSSLYVQEYGILGWGDSILITAGIPYVKETSSEKIRIKSLIGTPIVSYSLVGFIGFRLKGSEVVASSGLFEIDINGDCMPITDIGEDINFELDINGDIEPIA